MREIKKEIEQLEEVAQQLDKKTPTGARLALLLLDNLIELSAFKKAREAFALDNMYKLPDRPPKYSPKKRERVKKYFKDKVNFLVTQTKEITPDEGDVLKVGHDFRNEAYHNGILRDSIILSITSIYFEVVCRLIPRLWIMSYTYRGVDEVRKFLSQYGIEGTLIDTKTMEEICNKLLARRNSTIDTLGEVISDDLIRRIDEFVEVLESHQHDVRPATTPEWLLKEMQFLQIFPGDLKFPHTHKGFLAFHKAREEHFSKFEPEITLEIIGQWKKKAVKALSAEADSLKTGAD